MRRPSTGGGVTLASISVAPLTPTLNIHATQQMVATGHYSDSTTLNLTSAVTWASSDNAKATITNGTNGGVVTGVAPGSPTISATVGAISGSTTVTIPNNVAARITLSQAYSSNAGVPAATFIIPIFVPSGTQNITVDLSNLDSTFPAAGAHGPAVTPVDVAIYACDLSDVPTGLPVYKWTSQTIPGAGGTWTSPSFDVSVVVNANNRFVLAFSTPASSTLMTAPNVGVGSYVFGTASVDPLPGGFAANPSAVMTAHVNLSTGAKRIVVDGDSISQGYSPSDTVTREQSAFFSIGKSNGWCVDDCGIAGSTLAQWNNGTNYAFFRVGQQLNLSIALTNLSINDLPTLANLADYQSRVATRIADWQANGVSKIVWCTLPPSASYVANDVLRQSINAWLLTQVGVGGITAVVDVSTIVQNPANHAQLNPSYDSGDGTHWNAAGHAAVATALTSAISPF